MIIPKPELDTTKYAETTWLEWYKNASHDFTETMEYKERIEEIDSIKMLNENPESIPKPLEQKLDVQM